MLQLLFMKWIVGRCTVICSLGVDTYCYCTSDPPNWTASHGRLLRDRVVMEPQ
jgi:hypothetical protein